MEPEFQKETPQDDFSPDEAAASLAFATQLSEGMMTPAEIPVGEPMEGMDTEEVTEPEENIEEKLGTLKEEIATMIDEKIGALREDIKSALNEEED